MCVYQGISKSDRKRYYLSRFNRHGRCECAALRAAANPAAAQPRGQIPPTERTEMPLHSIKGGQGYNLPHRTQQRTEGRTVSERDIYMINPKSLDNLTPNNFRVIDKERQREIARRGGRASAQARRERKEEREMLSALMKYGESFAVFKRLSEMPQKQFDRIINKMTVK